MKNYVLIGMPSCGKTTLGFLIAKKTGREFVDTDKLVEQADGRTIPEIFAEEGESSFREKEREQVKIASQKRNAVISCGGGAVMDERNVECLKSNGFFVLIKRSLGLLSTEGRPLSKDEQTLKNMEKTRMPVYEKIADVTVINERNPELVSDEIIGVYNENNSN